MLELTSAYTHDLSLQPDFWLWGRLSMHSIVEIESTLLSHVLRFEDPTVGTDKQSFIHLHSLVVFLPV